MGKLPSPLAYAHFSRRVGGEGACFHGSSRHGKENYEFRRIYRKGKSAVSPQLVIYCQRNRRGHSRLGVSVSTKLGCAVVRNRVGAAFGRSTG